MGGYPGQPPSAGSGPGGMGGMGMGGGAFGGQMPADDFRAAGGVDGAVATEGRIARGTIARGERRAAESDDQVQLWDLQAGQTPALDYLQVAQPAAPAVETHLASLDVALALRGREYLFTTPRGEIEITARAVSEPLLGRLARLAAIAAGLAVLLVLLRVLPPLARLLHRSRIFAAGVLLVGLFSLPLGVFPIVALVALGYGLVQLVRLTLARNRSPRPDAAAA